MAYPTRQPDTPTKDPRRTMTIRLEPGMTVLFTGDSVTDCERREDSHGHLGFGYVSAIAKSSRAAGATIVNTGNGGDRIVDL